MMRSVIYFPEASISPQVWTLVGWMALGITLLGIGMSRKPKEKLTPQEPEKELVPA